MKDGTLTINDFVVLEQVLGAEAIKLIVARQPGYSAKYGQFSIGQIEAGLNRLLATVKPEDRDHVLASIIAGKKRISITMEDGIKCRFDSNGRFIPFPGLRESVRDPYPTVHFHQPEINYVDLLDEFICHLDVALGEEVTTTSLPSADEFEERALAILERLDNDPSTKNATRGTWLPWVLPQLPGDIGTVLEMLIRAVGDAYKIAYPGQVFSNKIGETLTGSVSIFPGTRHERIVEAVARGSVVGITLFPFSGYSVNACREVFVGHELSKCIPDWLLLGGGYDTAAAYIGHPQELLKGVGTPLVRSPAIVWKSSDTLYWSAHHGLACVDSVNHLSDSGGPFSASLTVIG